MSFDHKKTYEREVKRAYSRIAAIVSAIIARHATADGKIRDPQAMQAELAKYSEQLDPWAKKFWGQLLDRQTKALAADWKKAGIAIRPHGTALTAAVAALQAEQVNLIKTLPLDAAKQAQAMAVEAALSTGERAEALTEKLQGLKEGYPEYAARRLARTEIAKTQSLLVSTQAAEAGATHYIWRTAKDEAVRPEHAALEGRIFAFNDRSDKDGKGCPAPGQIWNCRCWCEPILQGIADGTGGKDV